MKQASGVWNKTFNKAVESWGFKRIACEWCVYYQQTPVGKTIFVLHVDDIISTSSTDENNKFQEQLKREWEISDLSLVK
jgi:hypothetical protein